MTARAPMFSVIIPTFNRGVKVLRAVRSVLAQTFSDFEILVSDDGSDDTETLLKQEFGDRVRYLRGPRQGVAANRNFAIGYAAGEWIAFLDSDDRWYPTKLQRYAEAVKDEPKVSLLYSKMDLVDEEERYLLTSAIRRIKSAYPALLEGNFIFTSTVAIRKACLDEVGLFDTNLVPCEDWDLYIRVTREFVARFVDESLVAYELAQSGNLTSDRARWITAHDEVMEKSLRSDPNLSKSCVRRVHAGADYAKAMIHLTAGNEGEALEHFKRAFRSNRRLWRAAIYMAVLSIRISRLLLPRRIKVMMRLPETLR